MDAQLFQSTAERLLDELPLRFRKVLENVVIVIEDFASEEVLVSMRATSPYELLGLYEGWPITEREAVDSGNLPDMIHLYRKPILAMWQASGESIESCIQDVLIHEIGHHFGFSDAQMDAIEVEYDREALT
ncbi:putative Zn-dependent protease, minimal metalloprotease (MMP)-like domain [Mariprofundus aestuarium]|uniref:Putative Zn-dependent protease, minimal metalloprotease (MMP)-like domain n=1 Tax=Mariprofundus aestuarium TaxID=1921086 RepID=A0A2K8KW97_MARES|nr:metallopeptidase family protein [Mariprofundus aestuarium]ATX78922.1 putative Zn-dependent protease, minimal metalloprotease (MMP)-like domain [Mariprofundus aestuarium]